MLALFSDGRRESTGGVLHRLHLCRSPQMLTLCVRIASNEFGQKYVRLQHCWEYRSVFLYLRMALWHNSSLRMHRWATSRHQRYVVTTIMSAMAAFFLTCYNFGFQTWSLYYELPVSWASVIKLTMQGTAWRRKPGKRIKKKKKIFAHTTIIHYYVHCFVFDTKPWWWWSPLGTTESSPTADSASCWSPGRRFYPKRGELSGEVSRMQPVISTLRNISAQKWVK